MRQFIRHPSDIPIEYALDDVVMNTREYLKNISHGGLCFHSIINIPLGSIIHVKIPVRKPVLEVDGVVVWSHKKDGYYEVGVSFDNASAEFRVRMVEQVCYIEHYKKDVLEREGRILSGEEAAAEWIEKNAKGFPR